MKSFDYFVLFVITISYNIFVHQFSSIAYKNSPYDKKEKYTTLTLVIAGILAMGASKMLANKYDQKINENILALGLGIGGLISIITAILCTWNKINDGLKLILLVLLFGSIIYVIYEKYMKKIDKK